MLSLSLPAAVAEWLAKVDWLKVGLAAAIPLAFFVGRWNGHEEGVAEEREAWRKGVQATNEFYAQQALTASEERGVEREKNQAKTTSHLETVRVVYAKRPPAECLPADRVQWLAAARDSYASPGERVGGGEADASPENQ